MAVSLGANVKVASAGYLPLDGNKTELPMPKRVKEFNERLQGGIALEFKPHPSET